MRQQHLSRTVRAMAPIVAALLIGGATIDAPEAGAAVTVWGSGGTGEAQFTAIGGVATDSSGNVYVSDLDPGGTSVGRVQKFSSSGSFISQWGAWGAGDGQFQRPFAIAVDSSDNVYVADQGNHRIQKFDSNGGFLSKWGTFGSGDGQFQFPTGVATGSGSVYVNGDDLRRVQKFDLNGNFLTKWGGDGTSDGQFRWPASTMDVDGDGDGYVADGYNQRIQKFDPNGAFLLKWGSLGSGNGQFGAGGDPFSVAVDASANVYVPSNDGRIQKFDSQGSFLASYVLEFSGNPRVAVDPVGNVFVGAGTQVWRIDRVPIPSLTVEPNPAVTSQAVTFDASASLLPLGSITKFEWDLDGDGTFETDTGPASTTSRMYSDPGAFAVKVRVTGSSGRSEVAQGNLAVEPSSASLKASPTPALTGQVVTFDASASAVPLATISSYEWDLDGDGAFESNTGTSGLVSRVYDARGIVPVSVGVTRSGGRVDTTTTPVDVRLAPPPGEIGISINSGALATNDPRVTISLVWPRFAQDVLASNDGGFGPAGSTTSLPVASEVHWKLQSSGSERLPKTVYLRFRGGEAGRETYTDDIILDQTPPKLISATAAVSLFSIGANASATGKRRQHLIRVRARDNASGVIGVQLTNSKRRPGKIRTVRRSRRIAKAIRFKSAKPRIYVRVLDAAGNFSRWRGIWVRK